MSLTIEVELKDVLTKIDQHLERIEQGQNQLKLDLSELKGDISTLDEKLSGRINTLDTKVDGLSTRISNQEFLLRTIVGGLILIILGGAAKMFWNFPANPESSCRVSNLNISPSHNFLTGASLIFTNTKD